MASTKLASPFSRATLTFLGQLERNNERAWFEEHKERYESDVRGPALDFIRAMAERVQSLSRHLHVSDKKVGGSLMRVHRDVRFSKDKRPYKTNIGIQFRHEAGKDVHAPGLYLHIAGKECFLGAGMWHPEASALSAVRETIAADPKHWQRIRDGKRFRKHWSLAGDSLKRPPRGYTEDQPCADDLKRKDHIAIVSLTAKQVTSENFLDLVSERFAEAKAYMAFQAAALGLPF
jgi:uncharacterized protein (TIGR02453 family)